jgi:seryl-tRNA synthetase
MYDIKWIRDNPEAFDRGLTRRGLKPLSQHLLSIDNLRRARTRVLEDYQSRRRKASDEIHQAMARKDAATEEKLRAEVAECKNSIATIEAEQKKAAEELKNALAEIPNLPFDEPDVPTGVDASSNRVEHEFGAVRDYAFKPKQHFELGEALGMMDFELAAKLSGARFVVLQKGLARMERALGQFMLDVHTGPIRKSGNVEIGGYTEVNPPLLVRDATMFGTAQLPKFGNDQFFASSYLEAQSFRQAFDKDSRIGFIADNAQDWDVYIDPKTDRIVTAKLKAPTTAAVRPIADRLWLIPTAEVPLTNLVRESIVAEDQLPMRLTACTPCFRAEAGAAGKDTRGMIRQHQFTKVELVSITTPEKSKDEHERMLACAEEVLKKLDLHYRVVTLCTGDMGFAAQKTYDIDVWLPGQGQYREISSCSNCGEFQARRMHPPGKPSEGTRYRGADGKIKGFVHTLNGSGVAVGRALIAVMETYQDDKGAIVVPDVLKPYMGGMSKIERA